VGGHNRADLYIVHVHNGQSILQRLFQGHLILGRVGVADDRIDWLAEGQGVNRFLDHDGERTSLTARPLA
jgi:hypothetical protein